MLLAHNLKEDIIYSMNVLSSADQPKSLVAAPSAEPPSTDPSSLASLLQNMTLTPSSPAPLNVTSVSPPLIKSPAPPLIKSPAPPLIKSPDSVVISQELKRLADAFKANQTNRELEDRLVETAQAACKRGYWDLLKPHADLLSKTSLLNLAEKEETYETIDKLRSIFSIDAEPDQKTSQPLPETEENESPPMFPGSVDDWTSMIQDTNPSGTFAAPPFILNTEKEARHFRAQLRRGFVDLKFTSQEEFARLHAQMGKELPTDPAILLALQEQLPLPDYVKIKPQTQSLKRLAEEAQQAATQAAASAAKAEQTAYQTEDIRERLRARSKAKQLSKEAEQLANRAKKFMIRAKKSEAEEKKLNKDWNTTLQTYYKGFLKIDPTPEKIENLWIEFYVLREMQPESILPFLPWITLISFRLENETLTEMITEAKKCDPYLTYGLIFTYCCQFLRDPFLKKLIGCRLLKILVNLYPKDLILNPLITAFKTQSEEIPGTVLNKVVEELETAMGLLVKNEVKQAILNLSHGQFLLRGFSHIHRYLAFAWALNGDFKKAMHLEKRASKLPSWGTRGLIPLTEPLGTTGMLFKMANIVFPGGKSISEITHTPSLVERFILLTEKPQEISNSLACAFIEDATAALRIRDGDLPLIYLALQWITSHLVLSDKGFDHYKSLWHSLESLMVVAGGIVVIPNDWFSDVFHKQTEGESYWFLVRPSISFGSNPDPLPAVKFLNCWPLELTPESINAWALRVTQQAYNLFTGILCCGLSYQIAEHENDQLVLADNPTVFLRLLQFSFTSALCKNEREYRLSLQAISHLEAYLQSRPYLIEQAILEWATFCVYSQNVCQDQTSPLQQAVRTAYYPDSFSLQYAQKLDPLALRDTLLAAGRLKERSNLNKLTLSKDSLYAVFQDAQTLFGWRSEETFEMWGERLKRKVNSGLFAPGHLLDNPSSEIPIELPHGAGPVIPILRCILEFWVEFHQKTTEKNTYIADGGDEDEAENKGKAWHAIDLALWRSIIRTNTPTKYPNYKNLSKKEQADLSALIQQKHEHLQGLKTADSDIEAAALLLTHAEKDRTTLVHSVRVRNEEIARNAYRLLLEVAVDRLIRQALVEAGPTRWLPLDIEKAKEVLFAALNRLLYSGPDKVKVRFHGPEEHISGHAPLHPHYNAAAVSSSMALENSHIFFD
jgi:hypothetical protein